MAGHHPQRLALAAAADPDRRMGLLHGLGVALGAVHPEVLALVAGVGLGPHPLHDLDALLEHGDAGPGGREVVAVGPELVLVPPGADPPVEPAAAHHVDAGGDLGQQRRVPVASAADHLA